jgi:hypothetical protein
MAGDKSDFCVLASTHSSWQLLLCAGINAQLMEAAAVCWHQRTAHGSSCCVLASTHSSWQHIYNDDGSMLHEWPASMTPALHTAPDQHLTLQPRCSVLPS